ncbi:MAG: hypothetical protein LBT51_03075 [Fusobacteriaceae bacterium]|jgi:hypothetical protein|nr:hypothetical protein [Fusobacteriaceae bacterium]
MKVIYKTKLSVDEVLTQLSENIESETSVKAKKDVFIGKIDETNAFQLKKRVGSIKFTFEINGIIKESNNDTLIEVQIEAGSSYTTYTAIMGILNIIIIYWIISDWNNNRSDLNFHGTGLFAIFFFISGIYTMNNSENKIKMQLMEIFDAEIDENM